MNNTNEIERNQNYKNANEVFKETIDAVALSTNNIIINTSNENSELKPESIRRSSADKYEYYDDFIEEDKEKNLTKLV